MDYMTAAKAAFENRQMNEAKAFLSKLDHQMTLDKKLEFLELSYKVSKSLNDPDLLKNLKNFCRYLFEGQRYEDLKKILDEEHENLKAHERTFCHELKANMFYSLGKYEEARLEAIAHLALINEKRLYQHLVNYSEKYCLWFPRSIYFKIMSLHSSVVLSDHKSVYVKVIGVMEEIDRNLGKCEDIGNLSKVDLLVSIKEIVDSLDTSCGENVLMQNLVLMSLIQAKKNNLNKDEWKKLIELLVYDQNYIHLKLILDISLVEDEEVFKEAYQQIKKKKNYSFVKLTRYSKKLKTKILSLTPKSFLNDPEKEEVIVNESKYFSGIDSNKKTEVFESIIDEEDIDILYVEKNTIKNLEFNPPVNESIPDLIVTYKQMNLVRVVDYLIQLGLSRVTDTIVKRKIQYLNIYQSIEKKAYQLALASINDMLAESDLSMDEYLELKYTQGSLYFQLSEKKEALVCFEEVRKIDSNYRRLKERLVQIASN